MKTIPLRPADPDRDFEQIAALFSRYGDEEPVSEAGLKADYEAQRERIIHFMVAEDEQASSSALIGPPATAMIQTADIFI